ncbi:hypothetical protein VB638_19995 [Dolichospermum sp. UHCC 0684]|jgi:hypothetical protein|uniref:hypothetical protein n=1 Tax=unclassified Dolichospermum TaxID=2622029 RepID=UPI001446ED7D|nr:MULTISPECIES: hypothetical protein [unclassified Dolichospermum]MEA5531823.1 hypothetical protein [Dolichospermum sp. UHCC 0684]MTJ35131.1 hypothetical protein [Dolichospermum sp. UHCC 0260]
MKSTAKAIFSLGLISFLTLGGICQNAFAAEVQSNHHHHSVTKKGKKPTHKPTTKPTAKPTTPHTTPHTTPPKK